MNHLIPEEAKISKRINFTKDTSLFRLDKSIHHKPGEFVEVSLLGIGEAPFTICSYSHKYTDLCIRNVGNLTAAIHKLKQGDKLFIRGPYGDGFPVQELKGKELVFVGGGTGVAPLISMIEYVKSNRDDFKKVHIYFGFKEPEEILFRNKIKDWKNSFDFNITVDKCDETWKGNVCVVPALVEKAKISKEAAAIICGPPIMICYTVAALQKQGLKEKQIYMSLERQMKCGIGKCGHCQSGSKYICKNGPVFRYDLGKNLID